MKTKMYLQKKPKIDDVKNYENNLKVSYEALRKDLDIVLTSLIPNQKNLIKTYLWLNTFMIGICFLAINNISDKNATWYLYTSIYVCIILSFSSIFILIKALSHRASKSLGCFDMSEISNIQDGIYAHCECLTKLISSTQNALNQNLDIIKYRSNWIHDSFYWLIGAFIFFMLTSISFTLKDIISRKEVDKMANDNKPVISKDVKPVTTNIITNNKPIQTNDSGIMANKQVPPQKPQSKDTNKTKK